MAEPMTLPELENRLGVTESKRWTAYPSDSDVAAWGAVVRSLRDELGQLLRSAAIASDPIAQKAGAWYESKDAKRAEHLADWDAFSATGADGFGEEWSFLDRADPWKDQFVDFAIAEAKKAQTYLAAVREVSGLDPNDGLTPDTRPKKKPGVDLPSWAKGAAVGGVVVGLGLLLKDFVDLD